VHYAFGSDFTDSKDDATDGNVTVYRDNVLFGAFTPGGVRRTINVLPAVRMISCSRTEWFSV